MFTRGEEKGRKVAIKKVLKNKHQHRCVCAVSAFVLWYVVHLLFVTANHNKMSAMLSDAYA
jgi:hypothetical protein